VDLWRIQITEIKPQVNKKVLGTIEGEVVQFAGNGRKLGYPTANITTTTDRKDGVYFGTASLGIYTANPALIFIGTPTTVGDTVRRVEAYLLDIADKDYYGLKLKLKVQHFHRTNRTFDSVDELVEAMKTDEVYARKWFESS